MELYSTRRYNCKSNMVTGIENVGGKTNLARVAFYLDPDLKEKLDKLAKVRRRTLSNLMAVIAENAIEEAEKNGEISINNSDIELTTENFD